MQEKLDNEKAKTEKDTDTTIGGITKSDKADFTGLKSMNKNYPSDAL